MKEFEKQCDNEDILSQDCGSSTGSSEENNSLAGTSLGSEDERSESSNENGRKTVLVTGGAGFIGSHVAMALLERGDKVIVIDEVNDYYDVEIKRRNIDLLSEKAMRLDGVESKLDGLHDVCSAEDHTTNSFVFVKGDICDRVLLKSIFDEHAPTHVCHLAARAGVRPSIDDPFIYVQSNVMGTVGLLELAAQYGIKNFVYASSSSVYGGSDKDKFSEFDVVDSPVSQYAASKKSCELFAATYHSLYGLNCTGLRFFTVYGERGRPDMAPYKFIHRVFNGITIDMYGDGSSERDYTYIDDIANGVILALDKPLGNEVLNLGRGTPVNLSTFISTIERLCGRKAIINRMPMQPGDVPRTSCDTTKAKRLIGYEAKVALDDGLFNTVQWYKNYQENL